VIAARKKISSFRGQFNAERRLVHCGEYESEPNTQKERKHESQDKCQGWRRRKLGRLASSLKTNRPILKPSGGTICTEGFSFCTAYLQPEKIETSSPLAHELEIVLFLSSLGTFFWCFSSLMGARDLVHFERFSKSFAAFSTWF
jgi:hypothetical protein